MSQPVVFPEFSLTFAGRSWAQWYNTHRTCDITHHRGEDDSAAVAVAFCPTHRQCYVRGVNLSFGFPPPAPRGALEADA